MNEILAQHTDSPVDKIARDTERDFYLSAKEAKDYGIVDNVMTDRPAAGGDPAAAGESGGNEAAKSGSSGGSKAASKKAAREAQKGGPKRDTEE